MTSPGSPAPEPTSQTEQSSGIAETSTPQFNR